ncbi:MAG: AIM24 family protein, partial [Acidobacteriota bacterium]
MHHQIRGEIAQTALLTFDAGETAWASNGSLMSYAPNLSWDLKVPGGLGGAFRRSLSGEGVSLTYLQAQGTGAWGQLAANSPGHITPWDLAGGAVIATSGSFLAAWGPQIDINVTTAKRAGAPVFGGPGDIVQNVSGGGTGRVGDRGG